MKVNMSNGEDQLAQIDCFVLRFLQQLLQAGSIFLGMTETFYFLFNTCDLIPMLGSYIVIILRL
jgi:hypothetical protein